MRTERSTADEMEAPLPARAFDTAGYQLVDGVVDAGRVQAQMLRRPRRGCRSVSSRMINAWTLTRTAKAVAGKCARVRRVATGSSVCSSGSIDGRCYLREFARRMESAVLHGPTWPALATDPAPWLD